MDQIQQPADDRAPVMQMRQQTLQKPQPARNFQPGAPQTFGMQPRPTPRNANRKPGYKPASQAPQQSLLQRSMKGPGMRNSNSAVPDLLVEPQEITPTQNDQGIKGPQFPAFGNGPDKMPSDGHAKEITVLQAEIAELKQEMASLKLQMKERDLGFRSEWTTSYPTYAKGESRAPNASTENYIRQLPIEDDVDYVLAMYRHEKGIGSPGKAFDIVLDTAAQNYAQLSAAFPGNYKPRGVIRGIMRYLLTALDKDKNGGALHMISFIAAMVTPMEK